MFSKAEHPKSRERSLKNRHGEVNFLGLRTFYYYHDTFQKLDTFQSFEQSNNLKHFWMVASGYTQL